ncbi:LysR family transcriptional regulator [Achromobacter denitrificans]
MTSPQRPLTERDLKSLRVFCAVAQAGGFSVAEQLLNISKASISRHIREIEDKLGVQLCERGPAGFRLTVAGAAALDVSLNALRALDDIRPEIDAARGILSGPLTIGMVEQLLTDPACALPESLVELGRLAPDVRPEILVLTHAQLNQALRERRIQIGIRGQYQEDKTFNYQPLFVETHKIYAAASVDDDTARGLPLVHRPHPFIEQALATGSYLRGPDAGGLEAVATFVATGQYLGLLTEHFAQHVHARYPLRELPGSPVFHNSICAITEAFRPMPASARLFLDILQRLSRV